ncbi:MAG: SCP2 sterol-binding domain-containing protein [Candidatus Desulfofervidus sp.]|nr:SCP2 sterol-binding domain-containing protein [Candidatus Desulfofervidus sp.]
MAVFDLENIIGKLALEKAGEKFLNALEDEAAETFLEMLLLFMKLKFMFDPSYRRNIENFKGRYQFKSRDNKITVLVEFDNGKMDIKETLSEDVDVTVIFKDGRSLMNFLLSQNRDVLRGLLNNEITVNGNLNYIYKFAFMANHLQLELTGNLP